MASQVILLVVTAYTVISLSAAQNCSESQHIQYVLSLPNGLSCGTGFQIAYNTPSTLEGMKALDNICIATCAGAVAKWLSSVCNDASKAASLTFWCQPADNGQISRCRYAFDQINETLLTNQDILQCSNFTASGCPGTCNKGLKRLSDEIGCCFTNIYGNADFRNGLEAMKKNFFTLLSTPALWNSCKIDYPKQCTSEPFPAGAGGAGAGGAGTGAGGAGAGAGGAGAGAGGAGAGGAVKAFFNFSLGITIAIFVLALIF